MSNELNTMQKLANGTQEAFISFLNKLIERLDEKYREDARTFLAECIENDINIGAYGARDEISAELREKLKYCGIPFVEIDNSTQLKHTFFIPMEFAQYVESLAVECAAEKDLLSQITKDEINDLCYADKMKGKVKDAKCYEVVVPDKLFANRIRESLTKDNHLKTIFAIEKDKEGQYHIYCKESDKAKLNMAVFEANWYFSSKFAEINKKQEEYDVKRQEELEARLQNEEKYPYYIVEPEIDENGNTTGNIKTKIEITEDTITLYKDGETITEVIENKGIYEENVLLESGQYLMAWQDAMSRPIIIEEDELTQIEKVMAERNPRTFLTEEMSEDFKQDVVTMYEAEKKAKLCFDNDWDERTTKNTMTYIQENTVKEKMLENYQQIKSASKTLSDSDLSSLDKVFEIIKEKEKVKRAEITKEKAVEMQKRQTQEK